MPAIESGALTHEMMDTTVLIYGNTGIVNALTTTKGKFSGQAFSTQERATDVFVKQNGRWLCVLSPISGFRIFGNVGGNPQTAVTGVKVAREQDRRNARITWDVQPESQGYNVRWGIAPDKLYSSWMVYGQNLLSIRSLNVDQR